MNLTLDLAIIVQTVIGGSILWAIRWAVTTLANSMKEMNDSVISLKLQSTRMESWQESHDRQDDERHEFMLDAVRGLSQRSDT